MPVKMLVEARELAHEIIEAPARGGELAQREPGERRCRQGPEQQRQMREIAALGKGADKIIHLNRQSRRRKRRIELSLDAPSLPNLAEPGGRTALSEAQLSLAGGLSEVTALGIRHWTTSFHC